MRAALLALCVLPGAASAESVVAAVAANFKSMLDVLEPRFESVTGHDLIVSSGSTGQLFARIVHGAPYDVYFAADQQRPRAAMDRGLAVPGSDYTYAIGKLVLYAPLADSAPGPELLPGGVRILSIANPDSAPYGAAARIALQNLGVWDRLHGRIAHAQDVGGAFAAVSSGAADAGIVALAAMRTAAGEADDTYWVVPADLYPPLRQDVVLLQRARTNPAAVALLAFMRRADTRQTIRDFGYGVD